MTTIHDFVADLRSAEPALDRVLDQHIADHESFLPHVFMADVTRSLCATGPTATGRAVISVIADHYERGDAAVRNVVVASFLENLEPDAPNDRAIVDALPPALADARVGGADR
jgi:hypothetical protein